MDDLAFWQQFALTRRKLDTLPHFLCQGRFGWFLYVHPALEIQEVADENRGIIGWQLGHVIGRAFSAAALSANDAINKWQEAVAGRYCIIIIEHDDLVIYPDAGGTLALVYSSLHQIVASTTTLASHARGQQPSVDGWRNEFPSSRENSFWPAGLTSDADFFRLLPNHRLNLNKWTAERYWPVALSETSAQGVAERVASRLTYTIFNILRTHSPCYLPLTAGKDSRALTASAIACGVAQNATFVTFHTNDKRLSHEVQIACKIAKRYHLRHTILNVSSVSDKDKEAYLIRIGRAGHWGKAIDFYRACTDYLDLSAAWVTGFAGGAGRAFFWEKDSLTCVDRPGGDEMLFKMGLPHSEEFARRLDSWGASLPAWVDRTKMLDLLYLEMQLGAWASVHLYGAASFRTQVVPLADRAIFNAVSSASAEYRQSGALMTDVIERLEPGLLRFPFGAFKDRLRAFLKDIPGVEALAQRKRAVFVSRNNLKESPRLKSLEKSPG